MPDNTSISVKRISKAFKLPHEKQSSIKGMFINLFHGKRTYEHQQVLEDVAFKINKGEFFGIVGRNGSGKSTLLKLLAGIYAPDKGDIKVNGKLTPFIELGVGFSPELTGRENVFLNGALLGFDRKEMTAMYDEIVEFAELEKFMDQKLKNYSSGMQVRLAFSIAIQAKSDILLLDEVLAVGDEAFQRKCVNVFEQYKAQKQTVILVTHDMETVRRFCTRAILLQDGKIVEQGEPNKVASKYSRLNRPAETAQAPRKKDLIKVEIFDRNNISKKNFETSDIIHFRLNWPQLSKDVRNVGVAIVKNSGEFMFGANTLNEDYEIIGNNAVCQMELSLGPGTYYVMAGLFGATEYDVIEFLDKGPTFEVFKKSTDKLHGMVRLKHKWMNDNNER